MMPEAKQSRGPGDRASGVSQRPFDNCLFALQYFLLERETFPRVLLPARVVRDLFSGSQRLYNFPCTSY